MGSNSTVLTPAWRVVISAWVILAALVVVYAADINKWASAAETPAASIAAPFAQRLLAASESAGVLAARSRAETLVRSSYASQPMLGASRQVTATASLPPQPANLQLDMAAVPNATVGAQGKPAPTRVLIVGASSIQEGLGTELERQIELYSGVTVMRFGQYSTGLARPDYFDWSKKVKELQDSFKPDLIIAQFGENDCQGMGTLQGTALAKFGTDQWDTEYAKRIADIVKLMESNGAQAVMIGIPIMRAKSFSQQVQRLNGITQKATEAAGGLYVDTWTITADANGKYMASVEFEGKSRMIRAGDGIHLTNHGAAYVASKICDKLENYFAFTPK